MHLIIKSQNENFLSILNKNPNTDGGLYLKPLKNGNIVGYCVSPKEYDVLFIDSSYSYNAYEDNSMDYLSFCSPAVLMDLMSELFDHLLKEGNDVLSSKISWLNNRTIEELDYECDSVLEVDNFFLNSTWFRDEEFLLSRYIPEVKVEKKNNSGLFKLIIKSNSIVRLINLSTLVGFMSAMSNNFDFYIHEGQIQKYSRILANTNPPYFCWYLFIKRSISRSPKIAEVYLPYLESRFKENNGAEVKFTRFDTHSDRLNWCHENLTMERPVLDFGCGEMRLERKIIKQLDYPIRSYDIEDYSELFEKYKKRYLNSDWQFSTSIDSLLDQDEFDLVATEVGEHLEWNKFSEELHSLIDTGKIKRLLITTPNKDFNTYYNLNEDDVRRDDHIKELSYQDFVSWCEKTFEEYNTEIEYYKIGDCVGNDCVTTGVIVNIKN